MSLDELISIERIEFQSTKERIQETYVVTNLLLSKLFEEILRELEKDILPILDMKILLYVLRSIPFNNEAEGMSLLENLDDCMEFQLYGKLVGWSCKEVAAKIRKLQGLILYDYATEGSLKVYFDNRVEWDLGVKLLLN